MMLTGVVLSTLGLLAARVMATAAAPPSTDESVIIQNDDPLIFFHGRWDDSPGTWWTGSGFKLHIQDLTSLTLNLGPHTTSPLAAAGVSINFQDFVTVNVSEGANDIPLDGLSPMGESNVVRINMEGWQDNRMNLETIELNPEAKLLRFVPQALNFLFIGDSLSAGQFLPEGVDQAWPFLTGEAFMAEHTVIAQPGACLTDIPSFGNVHGVSFEFFRTEDTGFFFTTDHNFTTPWDFCRDHPKFTHVVIHIGANDAAQGVTDADFIQTYLTFIDRLRVLYPTQQFMILTPWGWPNADGTISTYFVGDYAEIVATRQATGDTNISLVNTTGWVTFADVFPTNQHPTVEGHIKISGLFSSWLETNLGLMPLTQWATPVPS